MQGLRLAYSMDRTCSRNSPRPPAPSSLSPPNAPNGRTDSSISPPSTACLRDKLQVIAFTAPEKLALVERFVDGLLTATMP